MAKNRERDRTVGDPLSDAELDALNAFLGRVIGGRIRNVEALDGFFAALACCPEMVPPSEYFEILRSGVTEVGDLQFRDIGEANIFLDLVMRHWNHVNAVLNSGGAFWPLLKETDDLPAQGNDWAIGFMTGVDLRRDTWLPVVQDEEAGGAFVPIMALAHEHDPDPEMRPYAEPPDAERREDLLVGVAAAVMHLFAHFLPQRPHYLDAAPTERLRARRPGRNDPCPCGSGKKFKRCCGAAAMH